MQIIQVVFCILFPYIKIYATEKFTQPTGVEWAWAEQEESIKHILPLNRIDQWHYTGVFVSPQALEASLRANDGYLKATEITLSCGVWTTDTAGW